jgi:AICAR transformylase/IMP cyclohydrolase PurH
MVRAAAKNHEHVYVVVDPADYSQLVDVLSGKQSAEEVSGLCRVLHQQEDVCTLV